MIQSFRTCKKENLSLQAFENLTLLLIRILDLCNKKKDIRNARKIMLMTFTIFTVNISKPTEKIFI